MASLSTDLLDRLEEYFFERQDVRDGSDGMQLPNEEMSLLTEIQEAKRTINIHNDLMVQLCAAAKKSNWIPPDYMMNDWISDLCHFLEHGLPALDPELVTAARDILEYNNTGILREGSPVRKIAEQWQQFGSATALRAAEAQVSEKSFQFIVEFDRRRNA